MTRIAVTTAIAPEWVVYRLYGEGWTRQSFQLSQMPRLDAHPLGHLRELRLAM